MHSGPCLQHVTCGECTCVQSLLWKKTQGVFERATEEQERGGGWSIGHTTREKQITGGYAASESGRTQRTHGRTRDCVALRGKRRESRCALRQSQYHCFTDFPCKPVFKVRAFVVVFRPGRSWNLTCVDCRYPRSQPHHPGPMTGRRVDIRAQCFRKVRARPHHCINPRLSQHRRRLLGRANIRPREPPRRRGHSGYHPSPHPRLQCHQGQYVHYRQHQMSPRCFANATFGVFRHHL